MKVTKCTVFQAPAHYLWCDHTRAHKQFTCKLSTWRNVNL